MLLDIHPSMHCKKRPGHEGHSRDAHKVSYEVFHSLDALSKFRLPAAQSKRSTREYP